MAEWLKAAVLKIVGDKKNLSSVSSNLIPTSINYKEVCQNGIGLVSKTSDPTKGIRVRFS